MEKILLSLGLPKDVVHVIKDLALADFRARIEAFSALHVQVAMAHDMIGRIRNSPSGFLEPNWNIDDAPDENLVCSFICVRYYIYGLVCKLYDPDIRTKGSSIMRY